jgi:hypothetical protein
LEGGLNGWEFPLESYQNYGKVFHPRQPFSFQVEGGSSHYTTDLAPYVAPTFFQNVISDLSDGRSDREFVKEAFNLKTDFVSYALSQLDNASLYQYPAETMTQGTGDCADTTILLASLLMAGNDHANYGMQVSAWYVERTTSGQDALVMPPQTLNHAVLAVTYHDGTTQYLETTANSFTTWPQISGWEETLPQPPKAILGSPMFDAPTWNGHGYDVIARVTSVGSGTVENLQMEMGWDAGNGQIYSAQTYSQGDTLQPSETRTVTFHLKPPPSGVYARGVLWAWGSNASNVEVKANS